MLFHDELFNFPRLGGGAKVPRRGGCSHLYLPLAAPLVEARTVSAIALSTFNLHFGERNNLRLSSFISTFSQRVNVENKLRKSS